MSVIKRLLIVIMAALLSFTIPFQYRIYAAATRTPAALSQLYARYAALIDADSGRVLFEKNGYEAAPNASTTKIMTCLLALELGNPDDVVTVSSYAASMPDVQLNIKKGERYRLNDLLYSLMLQSHNDSAVAIAEHIASSYLDGGSYHSDAASRSSEESRRLVQIFAAAMNERAVAIGCSSAHFVTPNGLDAEDENGPHSISAVDLARILAVCIQNEEFIHITKTRNYSFNNLDNTATRSVHNTNAFLDMMDGVICGKTGFTGNAGYCYTCAYASDGRLFVSVVLACGWPGNKTYKWKDTRKILEYAKASYYYRDIFVPIDDYRNICVSDGTTEYVETYIPDSLSMLIADTDVVNVTYNLPGTIKAPVNDKDIVGSADIYINDSLTASLPIYARGNCTKIDYIFCVRKILLYFTLMNY